MSIAKCGNYNCKKRSSCYRYLVAPDNFRETFAMMSRGDGSNCGHYWSIMGWKEHNLMSVTDADNMNKRNSN